MGFWSERAKVWENRGLPPPEERSPKKEERAAHWSNLKTPSPDFLAAFGSPVKSGQAVNSVTAQKVTVVARCVGILSESIAKLPLRVVRKTGKGTEPAPDHYLTPLLEHSPNAVQDSFQFIEHGQSALLLRGNEICRTWRDRNYRIEAIDPIPWDEIEIRQSRPGERLQAYYYWRGKQLMPGEYLHLRAGGDHPILGSSVITMAREAIGLALATEEHGARLFSNGAQVPHAMSLEGELTDEQFSRLKNQLDSQHAGVGNAHRWMILEGGAKVASIGLTSEDSQFLESRRFQVEDISRAFGVPLFLLNSTEKSTSWGSGMEQLKKAFLSFTLQPWIRRWEYRLDRDLLSHADRKAGYQIAFDTREFETPTLKELVEAIGKAIEIGVMSINEGREWMNLNQIADGLGGQHFRPANWLSLGANKEMEAGV